MIFLVVTLLTLFTATQARDIMSKVSDTKLNVHIVPHSHDDPGWLKTVDQYYSGTNSSIYTASVEQIFYSVVTELMKDADRTFSLCEVSFFSRWWHEQDAKMKETVKHLFANQQLSFLNGAWVMHDEASSHYVSMIDQTTLGHRFLLEELGYRPRVGWQIDPFGHSSTHAWLSNEVGFDGLFFGRIDYQDRAKRFQEKAMEMIWKPSASDDSVQVFTGAFSDGNYGPPSDFCFDTTCPYCRNDPIVSDPLLQTYNLENKLAKFIQGIEQEASITRGKHIMLKMGSDFAYSSALSWYRNLDVLIREINKRESSRFNLFYSDPTTYMRAKAFELSENPPDNSQDQVHYPEKTDDFFPYSDASNTFWTGYFTSRPQFKFFERYASGFLQIIRQWAAQSSLLSEYPSLPVTRLQMIESIKQLSAAVGLVNHHDCITGTEKQHVADDYKKILHQAMAKAESVFLSSGASIVSSPLWRAITHSFTASSNQQKSPDLTLSEVLKKLTFQTCRFTNETVCHPSQSLVSGDALLVSYYNPLPRFTADPSTPQVTQTLLTILLTSEAVSQSDVVVLSMPAETNEKDSKVMGIMQFVPADILPAATEADVYFQDPVSVDYPPQQMKRLVFQPLAAIAPLSSQQFLVVLLPKRNKATVKLSDWQERIYQSEDFQPAHIVQSELVFSKSKPLPHVSSNGNVKEFSISNGLVTLLFDRDTSILRRITRSMTSSTGNSTNVGQKSEEDTTISVSVTGVVGIGFYPAFAGVSSSASFSDTRDPHLKNLQPHPEILANGVSTQPSGTYIFRPQHANDPPRAACEVNNFPETAETCSGDTRMGQVLTTVVLRGRVVSEVHQRFSDWASHTLRLICNAESVEVEYQLGEIPLGENSVGKEIIYRLDTDINTETVVRDPATQSEVVTHMWYTDSNGREFMPRRFNYRPTWPLQVYEPIAGNYYPLTAAQYMLGRAAVSQDADKKNLQFSWLVDRSLGAASLSSGSMEVMIQRRLLFDDFKGVEEALNETVGGITHYPDWTRIGRGISVTGKFQWVVSPTSKSNVNVPMSDVTVSDQMANVGMQELRQAMDHMFYMPAVSSPAFLPLSRDTDAAFAKWLVSFFVSQATPTVTSVAPSIVSYPLPANVQLVTCEHIVIPASAGDTAMTATRNPKMLLVRLAHQFAINEDETQLSRPVSVDLQRLFASFAPQRMVELTLSANENRIDQLTHKIDWSRLSNSTTHRDTDEKKKKSKVSYPGLTVEEVRVAQDTMTLVLQPMQIRTVVLYLPF